MLVRGWCGCTHIICSHGVAGWLAGHWRMWVLNLLFPCFSRMSSGRCTHASPTYITHATYSIPPERHLLSPTQLCGSRVHAAGRPCATRVAAWVQHMLFQRARDDTCVSVVCPLRVWQSAPLLPRCWALSHGRVVLCSEVCNHSGVACNALPLW